MSTVTDALDALILGRRRIKDVEAEFRTRTWPRTTDAEGSFAEVADAYSTGQISHPTYVRLAAAAAAAAREQNHDQEDP